ncbi:ATP-dependent Clp protease adaptor ClpS [Sphingobacteriales bacterium UPWRP_1]|nr:Clp protease ClpS [Sphingobacteriales bacterium TSM_CSS]PSJ73362.1 ATP-dependent Clp protease adaptor ClpS [Sphingobacteriales bacterium UPWRP_1]
MYRFSTREWIQEDIDLLLDEVITGGCKLIVHNDDFNTFDWVIKTLIEVCRHTPEQAEQCSLIIHYKGKCVVKEGTEEQLKPMREAIVDRGIGATLEFD